jgi:hypothetical protein
MPPLPALAPLAARPNAQMPAPPRPAWWIFRKSLFGVSLKVFFNLNDVIKAFFNLKGKCERGL